eukprot:655681-Lingulodinium_polyedra.AAC.1
MRRGPRNPIKLTSSLLAQEPVGVHARAHRARSVFCSASRGRLVSQLSGAPSCAWPRPRRPVGNPRRLARAGLVLFPHPPTPG